jgi:DNA topoisomerase-1
VQVRDRRVAKIVRACQELPGQELLQYIDAEGRPQHVTSGDVNAYLREITGADITAKAFRTWAGTVSAAIALTALEPFTTATQAKRNLRAAIADVAMQLGNTPTICRKCYVHPVVIEAYLGGSLLLETDPAAAKAAGGMASGLKPQEAAVLSLLRAGLKQAA